MAETRKTGWSGALIGAIMLAANIPLALAGSTVTSADMCDSKAPALGPGKQVRKKYGEIWNISNTQTIPISCPVQLDAYESEYDIGMVAWNYSSFSQQFKCTLTEYDPMSFIVRSYTRTVRVSPQSGDLLMFSDKSLDSFSNRYHIECKLPPNGAFGQMFVESFF